MSAENATVTNWTEALLPIFQNKGEIEDQTYSLHPVLALVPKTENYYGDGDWKIAMKYKRISGRSHRFSKAQDNRKPSKRARFTQERAKNYAIAGIEVELIKASKNNPQSLADAAKEELEDAMEVIILQTAKEILRDGTGSLGQISTASNVATDTIALANPDEIVNFEVGDTLSFSSAAGSGARVGEAEVIAINREDGELTFSAALNTLVTGVQVSDYIQIDGDLGEALDGFESWNPLTAPTSSPFKGVDRTVDLTRLSGVRMDLTGRSQQEAWIRLLSRMWREGGRAKFGVCSTARWEELEIDLGADRQYVDVEVGTFGFSALKVNSPNGPVAIMQDPFMQNDRIRAWNNDKHELKTLEGFPTLLDEDSLKMMRAPDGDSVELRVGTYGNYAQLRCVDFGVGQVSTS